MSLMDTFLPQHQFRERHQVTVRCNPGRLLDIIQDFRPPRDGVGEMAMRPDQACSTPHHSAMNSAVALVLFRNDSRSTYSLKPWMASPDAPKHRLGMP